MNRQGVIVVDVAAALLVAALVIIVSPGIAVTGMIALFVLFVCAVSYAIDRRRRQRRPGRSAQRATTVKKSRV